MCEKIRCAWAGELPIYIEYHDNEWGRPVHDDNKLFEMLVLEGMQAGLNWVTVLKKELHSGKPLTDSIRAGLPFTVRQKYGSC